MNRGGRQLNAEGGIGRRGFPGEREPWGGDSISDAHKVEDGHALLSLETSVPAAASGTKALALLGEDGGAAWAGWRERRRAADSRDQVDATREETTAKVVRR